MLLSLLLLALVRPAPLVWWVGVEGVGGGGVVAWSVMAGVARCWALRNQAPRAGPGDRWWFLVLLVFLWLFGCWIVDASIFVAVCSDRVFVVRVLCVVFVCVATSYEGRMVDALASRADEGRRSLR